MSVNNCVFRGFLHYALHFPHSEAQHDKFQTSSLNLKEINFCEKSKGFLCLFFFYLFLFLEI